MSEENIPARFLDADKEPDEALIPIRGYEKYQLVSLKESMQPIRSLFYDIDIMIEIALRNSRDPLDGLTQDESASIHLYTMQWPQPHPSLFKLLNEKLRSHDRDTLKEWFLFLKLLLTALYKLPSFKGTIWRGVRENISDQYKEDHFWWGLSSCTETIKVIEKFIKNDHERTIFNIECLNGKSIRSHSYFKKENEILLLPGTYFKVVSKCKVANELFIIHLREQIPPYETLAPPFEVSLPLIENLAIAKDDKPISNQHPTPSQSSQTKFPIWKSLGKTVAGGNGYGDQLKQLYEPEGIFIDKNRTIFIADYKNHRIVQWSCDAKQGIVVAGGKGEGKRLDQLYHPTHVILHEQSNSLIINDYGNDRVVRWRRNQNQQEILIENIKCSHLTIDKDEFLYISDYCKNEVRRWKIGETVGKLVAGGNGCGNRLNQLNEPTFIFVDNDQSVYVSDAKNHRVMKWRKDAREGIIVAGGNGHGDDLNQFYRPLGLIVGDSSEVYVADCYNHRIMRWCEGKKEGEIVIGEYGQGYELYQLYCPTGLLFDIERNLYVADYGNDRIQRFDLIRQ